MTHLLAVYPVLRPENNFAALIETAMIIWFTKRS